MNRKAIRFLAIFALVFALVALVACKNDVEPAKEEAAIPSEPASGTEIKAVGDSETETITKVFTDLATLISNISSKDVEEEEDDGTVLANGNLSFEAAGGEVTVNEVNVTYSDFEGSAVVTDNVLNATMTFKAKIGEETTAKTYGLKITDFDLENPEVYVEGTKTTDATTIEQAQAVFFACIAKLETEFEEGSSVTFSDDEGVEITIGFDGGFSVDIKDFNLDVILNGDDGDPFSSGVLNVDDLELDITAKKDSYVVTATVDMDDLDLSIKLENSSSTVDTKTTTVKKFIIGFDYKSLSVNAKFADIVVLNVKSTDDEFSLAIVNTKVEDSADKNNNSSATTFDVDLTSRLGAGLKVYDNEIGFLADLSICQEGVPFKSLSLNPKVDKKAATVNGTYVDPAAFYTVVTGVIEDLSADD